jgi:hypothetical protein
MIFRKKLTVPILTLEGDQPSALDGRTRLRISAFIEMLRKKRISSVEACSVRGGRHSINFGKDS